MSHSDSLIDSRAERVMRASLSKTKVPISSVLALVLLGAPARAAAQTPDASGHAAAARTTSAARAKAVHAAAHHDAEAPLPPWAAVDPNRVAKPSDAPAGAPKAAASRFDIDPDKIDYGMKANGANVSPGQTRNQNYNGNVTGIGGELGMKVPF